MTKAMVVGWVDGRPRWLAGWLALWLVGWLVGWPAAAPPPPPTTTTGWRSSVV